MEFTPEQQAEVERLIQSEQDKVRTEYSKKLKDTTEELSKYKPKDKSESEVELENRLKALEDKEKEISNKEKLLNISNTLEEKGLPKQLAKYLQGAEDLDTSITEVQGLFNSNKLDNTYKPSNHQSTKDAISKEQFMKMSYSDRVNLFKTNEELYKRLSK